MCSVHALDLSQDLPLVHRQHRAVLPDLLKHSTALKLVTRLLKVVPVTKKRSSEFTVSILLSSDTAFSSDSPKGVSNANMEKLTGQYGWV